MGVVILGIETSCDETAAAVVEDGKNVLSEAIASSANLHTKTGGIIPENAAREQIKSMIPVINEVLSFIHNPSSIDAVAVTIGPGLIGSLLVGVETAKTLGFLWGKPIIPVNHLVAHLYANWIEDNPQFPAVGLVVSGGHTDLVYIKDHGEIKWLGGTMDDAAGECFDKCARLLGLPYPGGPSIEKEAAKFKIKNNKLMTYPRPMINQDNFDFSFSGLKTAVQNNLKVKYPAAEVQEAIVDALVAKSLKAIEKYKPKSFIVSGGVAANARLREKLHSKIKNLYIPKPKYCTDNAVMVATAGYYINKPTHWSKITADPNLFLK